MNTEDFACPNHQCPYSGITDAHVHALVGDGTHGRTEQIQTIRCQACHNTFTALRHTPLYRLKTPSRQVAVVLTALAEGLDPSAAERVFGYRQATISTWLTLAGPRQQSGAPLFERHIRLLPHTLQRINSRNAEHPMTLRVRLYRGQQSPPILAHLMQELLAFVLPRREALFFSTMSKPLSPLRLYLVP